MEVFLKIYQRISQYISLEIIAIGLELCFIDVLTNNLDVDKMLMFYHLWVSYMVFLLSFVMIRLLPLKKRKENIKHFLSKKFTSLLITGVALGLLQTLVIGRPW